MLPIDGPPLPRRRHLFSNPVKQLKHRQAKGIRNNFNRIDRGIRLPILDSAQVRLIEPALLAEHNLALAGLLA